ncbi:MAG: hypothetical protein LC650_00755 [Actinobacteria bacterium]|nr:hypothetical protein [Actinomycetota bacterium]
MATTREIIDRIMDGGVCDAEIRMHNAERIMRWVRDTDAHHTAETCTSRKRKDCAHAPGAQTAEFAAVLVSEAASVCACGAHGTHDPDHAATIGAEFIERWS